MDYKTKEPEPVKIKDCMSCDLRQWNNTGGAIYCTIAKCKWRPDKGFDNKDT